VVLEVAQLQLQAGMRRDRQLLLEQPRRQGWELKQVVAQLEQQVAQTKAINKYTVSKKTKKKNEMKKFKNKIKSYLGLGSEKSCN